MISATTRPAFVFDVNRCVGCRACEVACVNINQLFGAESWRKVHIFNELHVPEAEQLHLSMACNHCAEAPCMAQCPARAYSRDEQTGAIIIDQDSCLGCRYCAWVCPYDAPRFNEQLGVMTKCTFCVDRQHEGLQPSCTLGCPTGALAFENLPTDDLTQSVVGFAQADTAPAVKVVGLKASRRLPETHLPPAAPPWCVLWNRIAPKISFRHEWTLAVFTILLAVLTGLIAGASSGRISLPWTWFLGAGLAGMALSTSHLGRKGKAWRAGLQLDKSWLSREIVLSGLFLLVAATGLMQLSGSINGMPGWWPRVGMYLGMICLLSVDMVYKPTLIRGNLLNDSPTLHSAQALLTGLMFMATALGDHWVLGSIIILKLVLYWSRHVGRRRRGLFSPAAFGMIRTLFPLAGLVLVVSAETFSWVGFLTLILGEFLDRARFYDELEIQSPDSLMMDELEGRVG